MAKDKVDYRTMMAELTQLLADVQSDELGVDDALIKYERGRKLIDQLTTYIENAENKIVIRKR